MEDPSSLHAEPKSAPLLTYPYVKPGQHVTVTTTLPHPRAPGQPLTINGPLVDVALDGDGRLLALAVRDDPERPEPVVVPIGSILMWAPREPVQVRTTAQGIQVPA
jgi:hypothetical protein